MNLASIDLNLLVAFEAMMEARNVTRAAEWIGLAQPSMSAALRRLRQLFADELFIRTGANMQPTEKALTLARPISEALRPALRGPTLKPEVAGSLRVPPRKAAYRNPEQSRLSGLSRRSATTGRWSYLIWERT